MIRLCLLFSLIILAIPLTAQTSRTKVLVHNSGLINGKQTILIKWYSNEIYYPKGVNVYRREQGKQDWVKLNSKPITIKDSLSYKDYQQDQSLRFFIGIIKEKKKSELQGLILLNVLLKSFESSSFSEFLGILYKDETAVSNKVYEYKVTKLQGASEILLGISKGISALPEETFEEPVKGIEVKADTNKAKFKWKVEEERFYAVNLYMASPLRPEFSKVNKNPVLISQVRDSLGKNSYPKIMYIKDSLRNGVDYTFKLAGVDFFGKETNMSDPITIHIKDLIPPAPPFDLKDSLVNLNVILKWKKRKSNDIAGFNIYRNTKSKGDFKRINLTLIAHSTLSFNDKVEKAGPYYYYVSSVDSSGNESRSEEIFVEVHDIVPPAKPLGFAAKSDTGKVFLKWINNKEPDLLGYLIYRSVDENNTSKFVLLNSSPVKGITYTDYLPKRSRDKFFYKIIAIDTSYNKSEASEITFTKMVDIVAPEKPYIKSIYNFEKSIMVEWIPNKDADLKGYEIYRSTNGSINSFKKITPSFIGVNKTKYNDANIKPRNEYFYYIIAIDSSGNKSVPSQIISGVNNFNNSVNALSRVKVNYKKNKKRVEITWKQENLESLFGYVVYRKEGVNGSLIPITGKIQKPEYFDINIKSGNIYYYEIRAYSKTGDISRSSIFEVKVNND